MSVREISALGVPKTFYHTASQTSRRAWYTRCTAVGRTASTPIRKRGSTLTRRSVNARCRRTFGTALVPERAAVVRRIRGHRRGGASHNQFFTPFETGRPHWIRRTNATTNRANIPARAPECYPLPDRKSQPTHPSQGSFDLERRSGGERGGYACSSWRGGNG